MKINNKLMHSITLFLAVSISLHAADSPTLRQDLERTRSYRWLNTTMFLTSLCALTGVALSWYYADDGEEGSLSLDTASQILTTALVSSCAATLCRKIPPLSSFIFTKNVAEKSLAEKELEGFLLWVQDNASRSMTLSAIYYLGNRIPMPLGVQAEAVNMGAFCEKYVYANQTSSSRNMVNNPDSFAFNLGPVVSINLLFVPPENRTLETGASFITNTSDPTTLYQLIINPLIAWTKDCPSCTVNLWLDRGLENPAAIENTKSEICRCFNNIELSAKNLNLNNLRELPQSLKEPDVFDAIVPVYLRADLWRFVATAFAAKNGPAFYADLDIAPFKISPDLLREVEEGLFLLISGKEKGLHFENGVFAISENAVATIERQLIGPSIAIIKWFAEDGFTKDDTFLYIAPYLACLSLAQPSSERIFDIIERIMLFKYYIYHGKLFPMVISRGEFLRRQSISAKELFDPDEVANWTGEQVFGVLELLYHLDYTNEGSFCPTMDLNTSITVQRRTEY